MSRLPEGTWKTMMRSMPIPCVDVIVERDGQILLGFRKIVPYKNIWSLPGGRILKGENPEDAVRRHLREIDISADIEDFVGVFPMRFPNHPQKRHDITLCYKSEWRSGEPKPGAELARFKWISPGQISTEVGTNYRRMILKAFPLRGQHDLESSSG
jgi:ADP-ribose pyrophosphatase YjhB (NUDIX family)